MKAFLLSLLSGDEREVDSVIVCGVVALVVMLAITIWQPGWNPVPYATSAATVIGTIGGAKRLRDGVK